MGRTNSTFGTASGNASIFGTKIPQIPMPNPADDLSKVYPNLSGTNSQVSADILAKLRGELSPETVMGLQDAAATFGVQNGMGANSGLQTNYGVRSLGLAKENQVKEGLAAYNQTLPTVSTTQTVNPALQAEVNATNAVNKSAPDPAAANSYAMDIFNKYLNTLKSPAGGAGGGKPWFSNMSTASGPGWGGPGSNVIPAMAGGVRGYGA